MGCKGQDINSVTWTGPFANLKRLGGGGQNVPASSDLNQKKIENFLFFDHDFSQALPY